MFLKFYIIYKKKLIIKEIQKKTIVKKTSSRTGTRTWILRAVSNGISTELRTMCDVC